MTRFLTLALRAMETHPNAESLIHAAAILDDKLMDIYDRDHGEYERFMRRLQQAVE